MSKLLITHPKLVAEHKDIILECIDDEDISIRLRSLDLVVGMVNRKNIVDIVKRLITHIMPKSNNESSLHDPSTIFDPVYRTDIINRIIFICSQNHYNHINDFEWYITVLVGITYAAGVNVGDILTNQLMDVSVRVKSVREFSVSQMVSHYFFNTNEDIHFSLLFSITSCKINNSWRPQRSETPILKFYQQQHGFVVNTVTTCKIFPLHLNLS